MDPTWLLFSIWRWGSWVIGVERRVVSICWSKVMGFRKHDPSIASFSCQNLMKMQQIDGTLILAASFNIFIHIITGWCTCIQQTSVFKRSKRFYEKHTTLHKASGSERIWYLILILVHRWTWNMGCLTPSPGRRNGLNPTGIYFSISLHFTPVCSTSVFECWFPRGTICASCKAFNDKAGNKYKLERPHLYSPGLYACSNKIKLYLEATIDIFP